MIKEGMELLAGAYEFIDTAAASKGIDKGKRPMTPAECAAFESSQKNSGKPQLPQLPVPMEMQEVTFLPRVEPPPHATAFRNVPLYTDDCWKLPLPDSTRVAERQKDLCWPMKAALFDPTLHCFEKPPYWPAHLPKPAQHTGWPSGPNIEPAQVYYDNGMVKPFIDFVPALQHPPNTLNETHMARFNAEYMNTLEPIWQRTPNTDEYIAVNASVLPTHRMITTRTVQHNRIVVTTVSPQIQLTNQHLDILALVQDSHDLNPRFMNWSVDIHDLLQQKAMNPPPAQHVGAQMTPIETKKDIALRALALRHNHASDLLQQAREITGFQPDRYAGPSSMPETPPVSQPSTVVHDFDDLRNVMCGMMQGLGSMSGTSHENPPANVFALNSRRPYRAENFRPADRADPRPAQHPPQYFHQPENRIASAVITTTLSGLVRITKNPAYPKFADACEALFQPSPVDAEKVIVEMGVALNHMAEQEQIAFSCSLNGRELPLQGGEMFMQDAGTATPHTTFETPLYREPSLYIPCRSINFEEIPIISLLTPAMQIAESVPQSMQEDFAQVATNQVPTIFIPTASMPAFKFAFLKPAENGAKVPSQFSPMALRMGHFDTGCNVNLMSAKAFAADQHLFTHTIKKIKPFRVNMADGRSHTMTVRALDNVIFCMDKAYYVATFLVIDNLAIDYLIAWAFMLQYDVQLKPMRSKYAIGLPTLAERNWSHFDPSSVPRSHFDPTSIPGSCREIPLRSHLAVGFCGRIPVRTHLFTSISH
eukprot:jgi/Botrbrau1/14753/Bobra.0103s0003.1